MWVCCEGGCWEHLTGSFKIVKKKKFLKRVENVIICTDSSFFFKKNLGFFVNSSSCYVTFFMSSYRCSTTAQLSSNDLVCKFYYSLVSLRRRPGSGLVLQMLLRWFWVELTASVPRCPSSSVAETLTSTVPEEEMVELQESRVSKVSPKPANMWARSYILCNGSKINLWPL